MIFLVLNFYYFIIIIFFFLLSPLSSHLPRTYSLILSLHSDDHTPPPLFFIFNFFLLFSANSTLPFHFYFLFLFPPPPHPTSGRAHTALRLYIYIYLLVGYGIDRQKFYLNKKNNLINFFYY